jgi:membrane protease YdiL (CAAX protease family)
MKHLAQFLRSVIPEDPWQLILLLGVVFLFISSHLSWLPSALLGYLGIPLSASDAEARAWVMRSYLILWFYPITFAGVAGYFVCFWPSERSLRRILGVVCLPALVSLTLVVWMYYQFERPTSVLQFKSNPFSFLIWLRLNASRFPTGPVFCALGLALIFIFAIRLALGHSSLPIILQRKDPSDETTGVVWSRARLLIFVLIGPYFFLSGLLGVLIFFLPTVFLHLRTSVLTEAIANISPILEGALLVSVAALILGREAIVALRYSLKLPSLMSLLFAALLPCVVYCTVPAANFLYDRVQWAAHFYGQYSPPQVSQYFNPSDTWQPWLLLMVFAAFAEEIVFRGLLLPRFIERYGLQRGIFLIGIVWAAIHFRSDTYSVLHVGVLHQLANRIAVCLALNYVLSWMTLRWGSILPATVAHTVWNILASIFVYSRWKVDLWIALLAVTSFVIFRFWPVQAAASPVVGPETAAEAVE